MIIKVAFNRQFGGFSISMECAEWMSERGSKEALESFAVQVNGVNLQDAGIIELINATINKFHLIGILEFKNLIDQTNLLEDCSELISLCQQCIEISENNG